MEKIDFQKTARDQLRRKMAEADSIVSGTYNLAFIGGSAGDFMGALKLDKDGDYVFDFSGQQGGGSFEGRGEGHWNYSREKRLLTLDGNTIMTSITIPGLGKCQPPRQLTPTYFSIFIEKHSGNRWEGSVKDHHSGMSFSMTLERL